MEHDSKAPAKKAPDSPLTEYAVETIDHLTTHFTMADQVKVMAEISRLWYNACDKNLERVTNKVEEYTLRKTALLLMREMANNNGKAILDHGKEMEETMQALGNYSPDGSIGA